MPAGLQPSQAEYAKEVFAELLRSYSQKDLAAALGVDQSRVSLGKVYGRVGPFMLLRAALLAKRPIEEINDRLGLPPGTLPGPQELFDPYVGGVGAAQKAAEWNDKLWARAVEKAVSGVAKTLNPEPDGREVFAVFQFLADWPVGIEIPAEIIAAALQDVRRARRGILDACELATLRKDRAEMDAIRDGRDPHRPIADVLTSVPSVRKRRPKA